MEKRYYLDGKCIFSYDNEVFSSDEDRSNIYELLIDPIFDEVYKKYYEKQFVLPFLENTLKENDVIFQSYEDIKHLLANEHVCVEYIETEETLLKSLMREKLSDAEFTIFEELLAKAGDVAFKEEMNFLCNREFMIEHFLVEWGSDRKKRYSV